MKGGLENKFSIIKVTNNLYTREERIMKLLQKVQCNTHLIEKKNETIPMKWMLNEQ